MKRSRSLLVCVLTAFAVTSTHSTTANEAKTASDDALKKVYMHETIQFSEANMVASNIKQECDLGGKLATFIQSYAAENGITIELTDDPSRHGDGDVLQVEITEAVSSGNAFIGHHKFTSIEGSLSRNGEVVASFKAKRLSRGGFGAAFKGSCSVLGRTVKTLGSDVAVWLNNPTMHAMLGNLK